jgi:hypothetical protein
MATAKLEGTARKPIKLSCGHTAQPGDQVFYYRERALSYREAVDRGTMYPKRRLCDTCAQKRMSQSLG